MSSLFRKEVIEARQTQWIGSIRLARRPSFNVVVAVSAVLALSLVLFAVKGEITRKARLPGLLTPAEGIFDMTTPEIGVLRDLRVREGDVVKAGDVLALISTDRSTQEGQAAQLISLSLADRRNSLQVERRLIERQAEERHEALTSRLRSLEADQAGAATELDVAMRRIQLSALTFERHKALARDGFLSESQVQQKQEELLDLQAREAGLKRSLITTDRERVATLSELKSIRTTSASQRARVDGSLAAMEQEATENNARGQAAIVAPRDAIVSAVSVRVGQTLQPGRTLLTLVPRVGEHATLLEAHLYSPSRTAGFTKPGQTVWLRVGAYPYQKFGMVEGRVKSTSQTPISAHDLPAGQSQALVDAAQSAEPLYRIEVALSRQAMVAMGQQHQFKAGMTVQGDVVQDRRAIWEWLLEPVLASSKGMRVLIGQPQSQTL